MPRLLEALPLRKPALARGEAALLSLDFSTEEQDQVKVLLAAAADPDAAIHYLVSLKQKHPEAFKRLIQSPAVLRYLIAVASFSRFLSEEVLQNPQWLEEVTAMSRVLTASEYKKRLGKFLKNQPREGQPDARPLALSLALFRRQQILRILLRDVLGLGSLSETTEELSSLADAILHVSYDRIRADLVARHGTPRYVDVHGEVRECGMSVIALGKLGGR